MITSQFLMAKSNSQLNIGGQPFLDQFSQEMCTTQFHTTAERLPAVVNEPIQLSVLQHSQGNRVLLRYVKWQPSDEPHLIAHNTRPLLWRVKPCMPPTSDIVSSEHRVYIPQIWWSIYHLRYWHCKKQGVPLIIFGQIHRIFSSIKSQTFGQTQIQSGALGKIPHIGRSQYPYFIGLIFVHFIFFKANMF